MRKEKILNVYEEIFDDNGNVKPCGRDIRTVLIDRLNTLRDYLKDLDFGDSDGDMNIENIKRAVEILE